MTPKIFFDDFVAEITPTDIQREQAIRAHQRLSGLVDRDTHVLETKLQGSFVRGTVVRPAPQQRLDVDVVVITRLSPKTVTPQQALRHFRPLLREHYHGEWDTQGRSVGITDQANQVDLDLVVAAYQGETWHNQALLIPDREAQRWVEAHPFAQAEFTNRRNRETNGLYVQVVKALKNMGLPGRPKGYPLEALVGACCPSDISSLGEGLVRTLEVMVRRGPRKPRVPNPGLPQQDVLARISDADFGRFYESVCRRAEQARSAFDEGDPAKWRQVLGERFPEPEKRTEDIGGRRFG